jgi:hypothetical protein
MRLHHSKGYQTIGLFAIGTNAFGKSFGFEVKVLSETPGPQRMRAWKPGEGSVACGIVLLCFRGYAVVWVWVAVNVRDKHYVLPGGGVCLLLGEKQTFYYDCLPWSQCSAPHLSSKKSEGSQHYSRHYSSIIEAPLLGFCR